MRKKQRRKDNPRLGSTLDDLLEEDGLLAEATAVAIKRVVAWQLAQAMEKEGVTKSEMARRMQTSRSALDRLLDPQNSSVTLHSIDRAAAVLGKKLRLELVDQAVSQRPG